MHTRKLRSETNITFGKPVKQWTVSGTRPAPDNGDTAAAHAGDTDHRQQKFRAPSVTRS